MPCRWLKNPLHHLMKQHGACEESVRALVAAAPLCVLQVCKVQPQCCVLADVTSLYLAVPCGI